MVYGYRKRRRRTSYGRRKYRRAYKRMYRKKRKYQPSKVVIRTPIMPDRMFVKLKWSEMLNVSGASGVAADRRYAINNLFDPLFETGGTQPTGFDQWATLYRVYKVHGVKISINFVNRSSTITAVVGYVLNSGSTTLTSMLTQTDIAYSQRQLLAINSANNSCKMKTYCSLKKLLGIKTLEDDEFSASVTGPPNTLAFLHLMTQDSAASGTTDVMTDIKFTFYTEFQTRQGLSHS